MSEFVKYEGGYVHNCLLEPRGDDGGGLFVVSREGKVTPKLDGYAIIPVESYKKLQTEVKQLCEILDKIRLTSTIQDEEDIKRPKALDKFEKFVGGCVYNCLLKPKDGDDESTMFVVNDDGTIKPQLIGYAIVPVEKYKSLQAKAKRLRWTLDDIRMIDLCKTRN